MAEKITIRETVRIKLEEPSDPEYRELPLPASAGNHPASWECAHLCYVESQKT